MVCHSLRRNRREAIALYYNHFPIIIMSSFSRTFRLLNTRTSTTLSRPATRQGFNYTTTSRTMAAQPHAASQAISETAQAEGGPPKGSTSAQMQSQLGKTQNFEHAAQEVGSKMQNDPASVTSEVRAVIAACRQHRRLTFRRMPATSSLAKLVQPAKVNRHPTPSAPKLSDSPPLTKVQRRHPLTQSTQLSSLLPTVSRTSRVSLRT